MASPQTPAAETEPADLLGTRQRSFNRKSSINPGSSSSQCHWSASWRKMQFRSMPRAVTWYQIVARFIHNGRATTGFQQTQPGKRHLHFWFLKPDPYARETRSAQYERGRAKRFPISFDPFEASINSSRNYLLHILFCGTKPHAHATIPRHVRSLDSTELRSKGARDAAATHVSLGFRRRHERYQLCEATVTARSQRPPGRARYPGNAGGCRSSNHHRNSSAGGMCHDTRAGYIRRFCHLPAGVHGLLPA